MRFYGLALFTLPALVGCAELRTSYTQANGQPMAVYDQTVVRTGTQRVATGQDEVRDQNGNLVATNTHYENQQVSWTEREWYPMQGGARLDDESFYRITGDKEAAQKYDSWHKAGVSRNTIGWYTLAAGLAFLGGGIGMYVADTPGNDQYGIPTRDRGALSTVGYIGATAGLITAGIGALLIVSGKSAAHNADARLYDEPERVKADAERYNAQLGSETASDDARPPAPAPSGPLVAQAGAPIAIAPFTLSLQRDKVKKVELKSDGSILADGKKVASISGSDIKDTSGSTLFSVLADGSLKGDDLPNSKMRMVGDDLVRGENKVTVADDGTIVVVKKGGVETVGKIDKGSKQKRTAVLVLAAVATVERQ